MATFRRFEQIEGWQRGRQLAKAVYQMTNHPIFAKDYALRDQIRRAVISVLSNIAEGADRGGNAEFIQFLSIAKGSAAEVRSQLYIAFDLQYISDEEFGRVSVLADDTAKLIGGLMAYLRSCNIKGTKFKPKNGSQSQD